MGSSKGSRPPGAFAAAAIAGATATLRAAIRCRRAKIASLMRVGLFITCLADQFFPHVGRAAVEVLERCGCTVLFDPRQTCCGQPAFNSGYRNEARAVARNMLSLYPDADYIVAPSGSCTAMCRNFYPELMSDAAERDAVARLRSRLYEFSEFLTDVLGIEDVGASFPRRVTWHDSCHALRELRIREAPRRLLRHVAGLELIEMDQAQVCCGFGGTFSVKFPELSGAMLADKIASIERSGAEAVVSTDGSCLMQIAGGLRRAGSSIRTLHLAEVLASVAASSPAPVPGLRDRVPRTQSA
jgi:L-lactate dehydrogenase complex protein LldE